MARLTTFSRLLITLLIVAGVFFAVKTFLPQFGFGGGGEAASEQSATAPAPKANSPSAAPTYSGTWGKSSSSYTPQPFNFTAPAPVGGRLKGVVELGATGFNSFIVTVDAQKNWRLEKAEFGVSLVKEGLATDDDVKAGLRRYIADMVSYGVGARDIHFVVSSGAQKEAIMPKINAALKAMGYVVNIVTPEQEAKYALRAALPTAYHNRGFVVDIGSGNTKVSWLPNGAVEMPGAKYYQNNLSPGDVFREVRDKGSRVPSNLRSTCFIIGGVPYELAKQSRVGKERYTVLKAPADYKADGAKQEAGLNIYAAITEATGCRQFVFDWDANFTIGFLLGL
jgi:Exopolyphosphatase